MFLLDDLLTAPFKGLLWVFEEVAEAAEADRTGAIDAIKSALAELYRDLESGHIDEAAFDAREQQLLDQLDALEALS